MWEEQREKQTGVVNQSNCSICEKQLASPELGHQKRQSLSDSMFSTPLPEHTLLVV